MYTKESAGSPAPVAPEVFARRDAEIARRFEFLLRFSTPRTVFLELGTRDCELSLRAATYVDRVWSVDAPHGITRGVRPPTNLRVLRTGGLAAIPPESVDVAFSEALMDPERVHRVLARRLLRRPRPRSRFAREDLARHDRGRAQVSPTVKQRRVLILVENLPSPFDRRVWQEATTLGKAGYAVSIICPTGKGYDKKHEVIDGIHIWRYRLPTEGEGALGYLIEYTVALAWTFFLAWKVLFTRGFDVIHACNPPDLFFLIGGFFKLLGKKFLFDHHDANPELYEAKFGRRDSLYKLMLLLEKLTFRTADVSIATNESYRRIAMRRGGMARERVFVVRSGPSLERLKKMEPVEALKCGKRFLVGYVGVMGRQEGIDYLLRALAHLVHDLRRTDVHFALVGGGTSLEEMKALAKRLGVADYVTFTGRVGDAEMLAVLNTADVCVNPDVANEMNDISTMNKVMEYMALGKPMVQFDLTEGRFSAQAASLYARRNNAFDLAVKIAELLDDPSMRAAMGAFGRKRVERELEWRYEAPKLLAAYEALWAAPAARQRHAV